MTISKISCQINHLKHAPTADLFDFATNDIAQAISCFHKSLPGYQPTPAVSLTNLSHRLGVKEILVKDESQRFDLNAFKVLGASYAMARYLADVIHLNAIELNYDAICARKAEYEHITFVTATDGNHGRAVAWVSSAFGCQSVVYLPKGSSVARLEAIRASGATAEITELNYDDTVLHAEKMGRENGWVLLQDTSWEGYEEIPLTIMQGYFSLGSEFVEEHPDVWPTHVFLQAGVGSLAAGVMAYLYAVDERPTPKIIVVEPDEAPCLYESIRKNEGESYKVMGDMPTIMAGLACGEPSYFGLKVIKSITDAFLMCSDDVARRGMKVMGNPLAGDQAIISGESGAVTLGALYELMENDSFAGIRDDLGLDANSSIMLLSTEGDTDAEFYRETVWS